MAAGQEPNNGTTPDEYQYQEMGPMRFPVTVKYADTNETLEIQDHKMVFQLGDKLNELNGNKSELAVKVRVVCKKCKRKTTVLVLAKISK
jgi:hypothetical protein